MEYSIKIEEKLSRIVNVIADSEDEAIAIIEEMYYNEKIVLDSSDYDGQVMVTKVRYQESKVDEVLAFKRLKELEEGKVRTISAEEVWKESDL